MNEIEIKKQLEKIIHSNAFSLSGVYKKLLEYLTEATLKGEKPKEFTIGQEVFDQKVDDPSTSRVRVSVYKLRKRLEKYYQEEGKNDKIYFRIPKGGYTLEFLSNRSINRKKHTASIKIDVKTCIAIAAVVLLAGTLFIFFFQNDSVYKKTGKTEFWNDLINNGKETVIIAGDFFMYRDLKSEREKDQYLNVRNIQINSEEGLLNYIASDTTLDSRDFAILTGSTYMPRDALFSMQYILPVLFENEVNYQIILSSDFDWETYKDYNIIYIGTFKNLKLLSLLTDKLKIKYNTKNQYITVGEGKSSRKYYSMFLNNKNIDYSLVAKLPGTNNNLIYLFVSDNDIGCIESVKQFTQLASVKRFEKQVQKGATFFKAIYKAEGIIRTGLTFDLMEYEALSDSTAEEFWHN